MRSRMRGRGASWAYPNTRVKGGGGGRQGAGRAEASMRHAQHERGALLWVYRAGCLLAPQAARPRPVSTGRRRPSWPSAAPARGIALCIGVHAAYARSARVEWECACGQPGLMVACFPSRYCGDNHTVLGLHLCAQVHRCISLHEFQRHSVYVHQVLSTQGLAQGYTQGQLRYGLGAVLVAVLSRELCSG